MARRRNTVASPHPRTLADRLWGCLWPVGDDPGQGRMELQLFCCNRVEPGEGPYCRGHTDNLKGGTAK